MDQKWTCFEWIIQTCYWMAGIKHDGFSFFMHNEKRSSLCDGKIHERMSGREMVIRASDIDDGITGDGINDYEHPH